MTRPSPIGVCATQRVLGALVLLAAVGCGLQRTRLPESDAPPAADAPVHGRPGGLDVDFMLMQASESGLRIRAHRIGADETTPGRVEIHLRSRQNLRKCAIEKRVRFGVEGLAPGEYDVVLIDDGEPYPPVRVVVPAGGRGVAKGPAPRFGGGC